MKIALGMKLRDKVSGFVGIATGKTEWLNGCVRFLLSPPIDKDGKVPDGVWVDDVQLEVVEAKPFEVKVKPTPVGGPQADPSSRQGNVR